MISKFIKYFPEHIIGGDERREKGKLVHGTVDGADPEAFFGSRLAQVVVESEYPSPELAFPKDFPEGGGGESKLQGRLKQSKNRKKKGTN